MPVLRVNDRQHALKPGQTRLGGGASVDVSVSGDEGVGVQAIMEMSPDAQVIIRRVGEGDVKVNGVPLGAEPTPLMHGDKVEIAGQELFFAEDTKAGSTQFVARQDISEIVQKRAAARATMGTGGRLVSLVDGKEYEVPSAGITIGRDASSDVVVAQNEVSRRHAEIVATERGYLLHDYSTNGVLVNGLRVQQSQVLARSDVVRIGTEEFRFYADVQPTPAYTPSVPAAEPPAQPAVARERVAPPPPTSGDETAASPAVSDDVASPAAPEEPAAAPVAARPLLATFEVINEGLSKGRRFDIHVPLAHIGRGAHNDVAIEDDSVSETHAKLQRREDGWYLIDLGSTNGTYVAGSRVANERRLDGVPDVRFGGVKLRFLAADIPIAGPKGTRAIAHTPLDRSRPSAASEPKASASAKAEPSGSKATQSTSSRIWVLILVAALVAAFYFMSR